MLECVGVFTNRIWYCCDHSKRERERVQASNLDATLVWLHSRSDSSSPCVRSPIASRRGHLPAPIRPPACSLPAARCSGLSATDNTDGGEGRQRKGAVTEVPAASARGATMQTSTTRGRRRLRAARIFGRRMILHSAKIENA